MASVFPANTLFQRRMEYIERERARRDQQEALKEELYQKRMSSVQGVNDAYNKQREASFQRGLKQAEVEGEAAGWTGGEAPQYGGDFGEVFSSASATARAKAASQFDREMAKRQAEYDKSMDRQTASDKAAAERKMMKPELSDLEKRRIEAQIRASNALARSRRRKGAGKEEDDDLTKEALRTARKEKKEAEMSLRATQRGIARLKAAASKELDEQKKSSMQMEIEVLESEIPSLEKELTEKDNAVGFFAGSSELPGTTYGGKPALRMDQFDPGSAKSEAAFYGIPEYAVSGSDPEPQDQTAGGGGGGTSMDDIVAGAVGKVFP